MCTTIVSGQYSTAPNSKRLRRLTLSEILYLHLLVRLLASVSVSAVSARGRKLLSPFLHSNISDLNFVAFCSTSPMIQGCPQSKLRYLQPTCRVLSLDSQRLFIAEMTYCRARFLVRVVVCSEKRYQLTYRLVEVF